MYEKKILIGAGSGEEKICNTTFSGGFFSSLKFYLATNSVVDKNIFGSG